MATEAAETYLKGEGVYDHLGKIINKVVTEKPQDAYGLVEVLSRMVKEPAAAPAVEQTPEEAAALAKFVKQLRKIDKAPVEEDGAPVPLCAVSDFSSETSVMSWAGVGFGDVESYRISCALRALAFKEKDNGINKLRFWGKILGTQADYYVAEVEKGEGEAPDPEGPDADMEPLGTGANKYAYYVTTDLNAEWLLLPDVKPREIKAARQIKKMLSGNPKAAVVTHPHFAGKEESLLRAQIARITADTVLCIKGYMKKDEEDEEAPPAPDESFVSPLPAQLLSKEAWTHMQPHILRSGRTTYPEGFVEEVEEGEEETPAQRAKRELKESDPERSLIRGLHEDGLEWAIKQSGDDALYRVVNTDPESGAKVESSKSNAVTYVRSLSWPGAVCVACGNHFTNLYIGYGLPTQPPEFFIPAPPDVQDEPADPGEQVEPQGSNEPPAEEAAEE